MARLKDIAAAKKALSNAPDTMFKAVAGHHPFIKIAGMSRAKPVRRAPLALKAFSQAGVNLIMSGHTHQSFAVEFEVGSRPMVAIGAPTALSLRQRGETNGFWIVEADDKFIKCKLWLSNGVRFEQCAENTFYRS